MVRLLGRAALQLVRELRHRGAIVCGCARMHKDELSHYSRGTTDVEYLYPFGWGELEGIAKRGSFDLDQHAQFSGKDLTYFDEEAKARYRPWVIEPAAGVDRAMLAFMLDAYDEDVVENEETDRAPPRSTARPGQGRRLSAAAQGRAAGKGAGSVADAQAAIHRRLRSGGLDRTALSSPGRGRYAVRHHRSIIRPWKTTR